MCFVNQNAYQNRIELNQKRIGMFIQHNNYVRYSTLNVIDKIMIFNRIHNLHIQCLGDCHRKFKPCNHQKLFPVARFKRWTTGSVAKRSNPSIHSEVDRKIIKILPNFCLLIFYIVILCSFCSSYFHLKFQVKL